MDIKNIERKDGKVSFQVTVDPESFEQAVNKAYLKARGKIMIPGFRKGKAPRKLIESMYGAEVFYEDAVDALALDCWRAGMDEAGDRTVGDPAITDYQIDDEKALTISFETALYPDAVLGEYKGLSAYKAPVEVSEDEVNKELENVRKRNARIVTVDREAQNGDTVVIDFDGYLNGKRFDGGKGENHSLKLGSGSFVPGFEEQLVGARAGEDRELNITFPEDYVADLAGKDVVFKVKVHEVQEEQLPELDDEFAQDVSEFDTLDEYKASLKADLEKKAAEKSDEEFRSALLKKAAEGVTVTIPDVMINSRVNAMLEDYSRSIQMQGMTMEQYLGMMGMDVPTFRSFMRPSAESALRNEMMLEKVAEVEGLEPSEEEIEKEFTETAEKYGMELDRVKELLNVEVVKQDLKLKKATDLIVANGVATDVPEKSEEDEQPEASAEEKTEE